MDFVVRWPSSSPSWPWGGAVGALGGWRDRPMLVGKFELLVHLPLALGTGPSRCGGLTSCLSILWHYRCEWPQVLLSAFTIRNETLNIWMHLIGLFIFLALTIYTATKVPNVVHLQTLQHLPDVLRKANVDKIQAELLSCLPSLPHLFDLQKQKDELKTS